MLFLELDFGETVLLILASIQHVDSLFDAAVAEVATLRIVFHYVKSELLRVLLLLFMQRSNHQLVSRHLITDLSARLS